MKLKWTLLLGALIPFVLTAVEIEAENGKVSEPSRIAAKEAASGGKTVLFKNSARGLKKPTLETPTDLEIKAKLDKTGNYKVTLIIFTPNTSSDSLYMNINNTEIKDKHFGFPKVGAPVIVYTGKMSAGEQTIRFWSREPNLEIDKVIIEEVK